MRKRMIRLMPIFLTVGLLHTTTAWAARVEMDLFYNGAHHAYNASEIHVYLDGEAYQDPNMPTVSIDGRTMMPMRGLSQELGCTVTWNEEAQQVYAVNDAYTIVFEIGSKTGYKNGEPFIMDVAPLIINDRTMLPLRAFATAMDLEVKWDDPTRSVYITTPTTGGETSEKEEETKPEPETKPEEPQTPQKTDTTLSQLNVPASVSADPVFSIVSKEAYDRYEEVYVSDDKLVIDFYGAKNGLAETIKATNAAFVTAIRTAEHTATNGETYTRVVFDLTGKRTYNIQENSEHTKLTITFQKPNVQSVTTAHNGNTDTITITADQSMGANISTLSNPNRVVIDLSGVTVGNIPATVDSSALTQVNEIRTGWMDGGVYRIVVETADTATSTWQESGNKITVSVQGSTLKGISYNSSTSVLRLQKTNPIPIQSIQHTDAYLDGYYEMVLLGDYSAAYGYGTYQVNGSRLQSVEIGNRNGNTYIRFNQNAINAYTIKDVGDAYEIAVCNPQQVYDKVLLLDPGHGGSDPGASGNGITEKNMNLTIALKVREYLNANSDIKVYMTRDGDTYPTNPSRAATANDIADLMVSIHMNSAAASASGTETWATAHSNDGDGNLTSLQAAQAVQKYLPTEFGTVNRGVKDGKNLLILNSTNVPAILIETCFISNAQDAQKISSVSGQETAAKAIGKAIIEVMNQYSLR